VIKTVVSDVRQPFFLWGIEFESYASSYRIGFKPYPIGGKQSILAETYLKIKTLRKSL